MSPSSCRCPTANMSFTGGASELYREVSAAAQLVVLPLLQLDAVVIGETAAGRFAAGPSLHVLHARLKPSLLQQTVPW